MKSNLVLGNQGSPKISITCKQLVIHTFVEMTKRNYSLAFWILSLISSDNSIALLQGRLFEEFAFFSAWIFGTNQFHYYASLSWIILRLQQASLKFLLWIFPLFEPDIKCYNEWALYHMQWHIIIIFYLLRAFFTWNFEFFFLPILCYIFWENTTQNILTIFLVIFHSRVSVIFVFCQQISTESIDIHIL